MRKHLFLLLFALSAMYAGEANARLRFGVKGGFDVSAIRFDGDLFSGSNRTGWFFGPTLKYSLPFLGLGIDASALYDRHTSMIDDVSAQSGQTTFRQQAVVMPLNLRLDFGVSRMAGMFLFAGPQFDFNVGDTRLAWKNRYDVENVFRLKRAALSVNIGVGLTLWNILQLSAGCNMASGKRGDVRSGKLPDQVFQIISEGSTTGFQIGLACYL